MNKKIETINTYNKSASRMAQRFNDIGARIDDVKQGFSYIHKKNPKVLEIGCGNGREARKIVKNTSNYVGIDISEEFIKIAKDYVPEGKFVVADVENFTFPNNIDIIFAFASLLHSDKDKIKNILRSAHSSLNDGGIFYISLKYGDYREETKEDEFGTRTYYFYTPEMIIQLADGGYKVVTEETQEMRGQKWFTIVLQKQPIK